VVYCRAIDVYSAVAMADERMRFRLRTAAAWLEKGGFVTATFAFLAPFFYADPGFVRSSVFGVAAFLAPFALVLMPRSYARTLSPSRSRVWPRSWVFCSHAG
jgi:hypothetical protein